MPTLTYNDLTFTVAPRGDRWDLSYALPNGSSALAGAGLFAGLPSVLAPFACTAAQLSGKPAPCAPAAPVAPAQ